MNLLTYLNIKYVKLLKNNQGAEETAQQLGGLAAFSGNLSSVPSMHV